MSFRLHHSITVSAPYSTVWPLLFSATHLSRLQTALDGCKACTVTPSTSTESSPAARTPCSITAAQTLALLLNSTSLPTPEQLGGMDWLAFDAADADAVRFEFMLSPFGTKVEGVQVAYCSSSASESGGDYGIVLFHSHVVSAGIEERKMRLVEASGAGETKVTETVWGTAPRALAWTLKGTGVAAKTHRSHVDSYPRLLANFEADQGKA